MNGPSVPRRGDEGGFVLVGVIIFMLALTILGLSLFSLSGYESRFLGTSVDQEQAFYAASGGLEHAMFVMAKNPNDRAAVKTGLPWQNIVYAVCMQGPNSDSTGPMVPDTTANGILTVRVKSSVRNNTQTAATCLIEAKFKPLLFTFAYRYLMSLTTTLTGATEPINLQGAGNKIFLGSNPKPAKVWQNSVDVSSWGSGAGKARGNYTWRIGGVPDPVLTGFMPGSNNWATADGPKRPGSSNNFDLQAGNGQWQFFKTDVGSSTNAAWSLKDTTITGSALDIGINGKCVWLFDHGVRFTREVTLHRSSQSGTSALVLVARKGSDPTDPEAAVWFAGGLDKGNNGQGQNYCPLIIVTDGRVRIEAGADVTMEYITIYAKDCWLNQTGTQGNPKLTLIHDVNAPEDQPDGILQQLADLGLLPGVPPATADRFVFISGTWKQL